MIELKGKYNTAKIFTDVIEDECVSQILTLLNQPFVENCKIRIMPDCHAGSGCVIGFTANLGDKIIPNLVGVDIGCGCITIPLGNVDIDFKKLDRIIKQNIPSGFNINKKKKAECFSINNMYCYDKVIKHQVDKVTLAIGSLGGGNHFIEIDKDFEGNKYLLIHTGSRHLGLDVCKYYQNLAGRVDDKNNINNIISHLKASGRESEIEKTIQEYKQNNTIKIPKNLLYLKGKLAYEYLHDMKICQEYAALNRFTIAKEILTNYFNDCQVQLSSGGTLKIKQKGKYNIKTEWFDTIHNYIGDDDIIRKGAVSAKLDETLIIPINMRDGALICKGKGNEDWNNSVCHGAGRVLSRGKARETIDLQDYKDSMNGIYSTCINEGTLDESPFAYKGIYDIVDNIGDTVEIIKTIKPIYNFKASE